MNNGDIVYFDKLVFRDGSIDTKYHRPCIVMASRKSNKGNILLFCLPVTSNINAFNKHKYKHVLIGEPIYRYKVLSFAKLDGLFVNLSKNAHYTGITLSAKTMQLIESKLMDFPMEDEIYMAVKELINKSKEKTLVKKR